MEGNRIRWNYPKVDELRERVADWILEHQDYPFAGGMTFKEFIAREAEWHEDEETTWVAYLEGVRDWRRSQWGDEATLLALSGVAGRQLITLSGKAFEEPRILEYAPPPAWGGIGRELPIILLHDRDHHFTPVKVTEGGEWSWVKAWEKVAEGGTFDERMIVRVGSADTRGMEARNKCRAKRESESFGTGRVAQEGGRGDEGSHQVRNYPLNQRLDRATSSAVSFSAPRLEEADSRTQKMVEEEEAESRIRSLTLRGAEVVVMQLDSDEGEGREGTGRAVEVC